MFILLRRCCLLFLLGGILSTAPAASPSLTSLTMVDGLPSNQILCLARDADGYMWIGTDAGVARYDGYRFDLFNRSNGLPQNEVFNILLDSKNRVWMLSFHGMSVFHKGRLYQASQFQPNENWEIKSLIPWKDGVIVQMFYKDAYHQFFVTKGRWNRIPLPDSKGTLVGADGKIWANNGTKLVPLVGSNLSLALPRSPKKMISVLGGLPEKVFVANAGIIRLVDSTLVLQPLVDHQGHPLSDFQAGFLDSQGDLWFSVSGKGVYRYTWDEFLRGGPPSQYFTDVGDVNWIEEDADRNIWLGTFRNGIKIWNRRGATLNYPIQMGDQEGQSVEDILQLQDGRICLTHSDGWISFLQVDTCIGKQQVLDNCWNCQIRQVVEVDGRHLMAVTNHGGILLPEGQSPEHWIYGSIKNIHADGDEWHIGYHRGLISLPRDSLLTTPLLLKPYVHKTNQRTYTTCRDQLTGDLWIGTYIGLLRLPAEGGPPEVVGPYVGINHLFQDRSGRIWVSTDGLGVLVVEAGKMTWLTEAQGLNSNLCREVTEDQRGSIWIATQKGLNYIANRGKVAVVRSLTQQEGLPSDEIHCFEEVPPLMWVGTSRGAVGVPLDLFDRGPSPLPQLRPLQFQAAGRDTFFHRPISLPPSPQDIRIAFSTTNSFSRSKIEYRYRLLHPTPGPWTRTFAREVQYPELGPGNYDFEVQARSYHGPWGPYQHLSFAIAPQFYQTAWFQFLTLALGLAVAAGLTYLRVRYVRRKERQHSFQEHQLLELRMQALRARMNPHFISNSLSHIQHFISSGDATSAHKYLAVFSRLIRQTLENSRFAELPLADSLRHLRHYLELEHLRFRDQFSYAIEVAPDLDPCRIFVPPLLIQPFVENAIQHGLRHKPGRGHLQIAIHAEADQLVIAVEDDGVGRKVSQGYRASDEQPSRGIEMVRQHLASLSNLHHQPAHLHIEDLSDAQGTPAGTRVTLVLPLNQTSALHDLRHPH